MSIIFDELLSCRSQVLAPGSSRLYSAFMFRHLLSCQAGTLIDPSPATPFTFFSLRQVPSRASALLL